MASSQVLVSSFNLDSDLPVAHVLQADSFYESRAESRYHTSLNLTLYSRLVLRVAYVYAGRIYLCGGTYMAAWEIGKIGIFNVHCWCTPEVDDTTGPSHPASLLALHLAGFLLLPSLYFFRVDYILKEIDFTVKETAHMYVATRKKAEEIKETENAITSETAKNDAESGVHDTSNPLELSPSYPKLTKEWNNMIDDFVEEWRTLNVVSAVLVPGILTLFQIDGAANDPVTRSLAFWSLILALWSLVYGCLYIIQFRRMRNERVMMQWALEAEEHEGIFWNTWIMLALPAVSLAWSVLVFIISIIWFMWRSRASPPPEPSFPATPSTELGFRIFTCTILGAGAGYFVLAFMQFFRLDIPTTGRWRRHMNTIMAEAIASAQEKSQLSPPN